jgi:hypothetical protein
MLAMQSSAGWTGGRDPESDGKGHEPTIAMNTVRTLKDLDKHAEEFDFPILDNAYVEFGAARLTVFADSTDWLIVFEVLGFSIREVEFVIDLYVFGSCVERQGYVGEEIPLTSIPSQPLYDRDTNEFIADRGSWSIQHNGEVLSFSPTPDEYEGAGIAVNRVFREIDLLRFLIFRLGPKSLMLDDEVLLSRFPKCPKMRKLIQTFDWHHPDVSGGEKPSATKSMQSLLLAISDKDPALFDSGIPNTLWKFWSNNG